MTNNFLKSNQYRTITTLSNWSGSDSSAVSMYQSFVNQYNAKQGSLALNPVRRDEVIARLIGLYEKPLRNRLQIVEE